MTCCLVIAVLIEMPEEFAPLSTTIRHAVMPCCLTTAVLPELLAIQATNSIPHTIRG